MHVIRVRLAKAFDIRDSKIVNIKVTPAAMLTLVVDKPTAKALPS
jgi:hypothetical protein